MRVRRTLPPAAALLELSDLLHGLAATFHGASYTRRLEAELREYFGAKHVFLVSSGKAALTMILLALRRLSDRREVLVPAYTCFSVPAAVERAGLSVRLADVDPVTFDFDHGSLLKSIGSETLCVVSHHLFGVPSDIESVQRACAQTGAFLIEDAAQAMGGRDKGRMLGSQADVGFFSLGRGKNITAGSGGIILTNCDRLAATLAAEYQRLRAPGLATSLGELARIVLMAIFIRPSLYWLPAALPFLRLGQTRFERDFPLRRISGMSTGILRHWRSRLAEANRIRVATAGYFASTLRLENVPGATIPYLRLPVLMHSREARDRVCAFAARRGLGVGRMYPTPLNEIEELEERFTGQTFPAAKLIAERLLTLPTHHLLAERDRRAVRDLLDSGREFARVNEQAPANHTRHAEGKCWR